MYSSKIICIFGGLILLSSTTKSQDTSHFYKIKRIEVTNFGLTDLYLSNYKFVDDIMEFFHTPTRENTIRQGLLFSENDTVNNINIAESERVLRDYSFLRNVRIILDTAIADSATAKVFVGEKISKTYNAAFSSTKKSKFSLGINEANLFGYGKSLSVGYDRQSGEGKKDNYSIIYSDKQLFGSHWNTIIQYKLMPFETIRTFYLSKPFLSDDRDNSISFYVSKSEVNNPTFEQGKIISSLKYDEWVSNIYFTHRFSKAPILSFTIGSFNTWTLYKGSRTYVDFDANNNYLFVSFQFLNRIFAEVKTINQLCDYEDIPLGTNISATSAIQVHSGKEFSDYRLALNMQHSFFINSFYAAILHILKSDIISGRPVNTTDFTQINVFFRYKNKFLSGIKIANYTSANQPIGYSRNITLGETNGLPGYAEDYFSGRNMLVINWENRLPLEFSFFVLRFASFANLNVGTVYNNLNELKNTKFYRSSGIGFHIDNEAMKGKQLTSIALIYNYDLPPKYSVYITSKLNFDFYQNFNFEPF